MLSVALPVAKDTGREQEMGFQAGQSLVKGRKTQEEQTSEGGEEIPTHRQHIRPLRAGAKHRVDMGSGVSPFTGDSGRDVPCALV